jgi:hypothetical protein
LLVYDAARNLKQNQNPTDGIALKILDARTKVRSVESHGSGKKRKALIDFRARKDQGIQVLLPLMNGIRKICHY